MWATTIKKDLDPLLSGQWKDWMNVACLEQRFNVSDSQKKLFDKADHAITSWKVGKINFVFEHSNVSWCGTFEAEYSKRSMRKETNKSAKRSDCYSGGLQLGTKNACQRVGTPGLGSRLSTYWPTKWRCSQHTPLPIKLLSTAPSGLKPKGRVCEERMIRRSQTRQAWLELQSQ